MKEQTRGNRLLSMLLACIILLGMLPFSTTTASAADNVCALTSEVFPDPIVLQYIIN